MKTEEFVVGLDFGSTKICAIVASLSQDIESTKDKSTLNILGVGTAASVGIKKGVVVNIDDTVASLTKALREAEMSSGLKISKAVVGIAGPHVRGINSSGVVGIKGKEVSKIDLTQVIDAARAVAIPNDRIPIHVIPQEFTIDDQGEIRDPLGMVGTRLEAKVHIVTAAKSAVQNILRCCQKTGIHVSEFVLQPLAAAEAILFNDELELGVALVDIGGGTTDLAIFNKGSIIHSSGIPLGGVHVTQDLAIGLRTPQKEAELLKKTKGFALKKLMDESATVEVPSVGGRPARLIEQKLLGEIIEPRMEEIFQMVNREIIAAGCSDTLGGGIVLTGGATMLPGTVELAEFIFDLPVKRAQPEGLEGFSDILMDPAYSTAVGLVKRQLKSKRLINSGQGKFTGTFKSAKDQFKNWIENFF